MIIDEVDSILIDEARIPLVIAGGSVVAGSAAVSDRSLARGLVLGRDYTKDEYARNVNLTEHGVSRSKLCCDAAICTKRKIFRCSRAQSCPARERVAAPRCGLCRQERQRRVGGRIKAALPRIAAGPMVCNRRSRLRKVSGLDRGASARVHHNSEPDRLYPKVAGMTATASTQAEEFKQVYDLDIVRIPTNRPQIRVDHDDVFFTHRAAKEVALIEHIATVHATGRPILVGTSSVAESERLGRALAAAGIPNHILNARRTNRKPRSLRKRSARCGDDLHQHGGPRHGYRPAAAR